MLFLYLRLKRSLIYPHDLQGKTLGLMNTKTNKKFQMGNKDLSPFGALRGDLPHARAVLT